MSNQADKTVSSAPAAPAVEMTFAEFLESSPPETEKFASGVPKHQHGFSSTFLANPDLHLHCEYEGCDGIRTFYCQDEPTLSDGEFELKFLTYVTRNCRRSRKVFALLIRTEGRTNGFVYKFGEVPIFGPPTPSRLISLVGEAAKSIITNMASNTMRP